MTPTGAGYLNGMKFTTYDRDSDLISTLNCANNADNAGGFWYKRCTSATITSTNVGVNSGLTWQKISGLPIDKNLLSARMTIIKK